MIKKNRIQSIDLLRGLVMIIMALDHTRDFFHIDVAIGNDPLNFATTSPLLFMTRWITHFCAPVFVFLAGSSAYFSGRTKTKRELSFFLFTRGLWLIFLEVTVIYFSWQFNFYYALVVLQVIWAIGLSMVFLSILVYLPKGILWLIGIILVFGHNSVDQFNEVSDSFGGFIWSVLHVPHPFSFGQSHTLFVLYPVLPWLGAMMLGYLFGDLYKSDMDAAKRKKLLLQLGIGSILLFVLLRSINLYGDASHWNQQSNFIFTVLSFINATKYPPSLLYLLMTIGPAMIFLAFTENATNKISRFISVYGRVPMFYYIIHFYLLHTLAFTLFFATGHTSAELDFINRFAGFPENFGFHLWLVYLIWIGVILLLYFPCRWYDKYKSTHTQWWLSYL